jgi:tRNA threonylcarbamoyladenosine biosynthesis protein TsaB
MILGIETAGQTTRLWLLESATAVIGEPAQQWDSGRELSNQLLGHIQALVQEAGHQLTGLKGIVIFSGPGSFTSLRIGHAVANALADSLGIAVVGAQGEQWLATGLRALGQAKPGRQTLPHYGSEAHITKPKA